MSQRQEVGLREKEWGERKEEVRGREKKREHEKLTALLALGGSGNIVRYSRRALEWKRGNAPSASHYTRLTSRPALSLVCAKRGLETQPRAPY